eukprot:CAMPEP_0172773032 /NCGR_PEP_ID=MMETSP1074-20121228/193543_1 /TAXON_ID=2916 /ORGANISM="Ceratium fusus, Strain PA161109" /LENGTH=93 /DNA_ID=CAMNT_0013609249 /DNA_START=48 /DNA_END=329 /DNA_ORIENTATION=-
MLIQLHFTRVCASNAESLLIKHLLGPTSALGIHPDGQSWTFEDCMAAFVQEPVFQGHGQDLKDKVWFGADHGEVQLPQVQSWLQWAGACGTDA